MAKIKFIDKMRKSYNQIQCDLVRKVVMGFAVMAGQYDMLKRVVAKTEKDEELTLEEKRFSIAMINAQKFLDRLAAMSFIAGLHQGIGVKMIQPTVLVKDELIDTMVDSNDESFYNKLRSKLLCE